jgi:stage III sporulation protein AF
MDSIKQWAMTICFAALAAGLANIIAPKGNLEKVYKFAVSLFFLCCVLVPLFNLKGISLNMNLQSVTQQNSNLQKTVDEQKLSEIQSSVSALITEACQKKGVTPLSVTTKAVIDKSGNIAISSVVVKLKKENMVKKTEIVSAVKDELGIDITIEDGEK